jgi:DNA-binding NarL/FixJ family response regulator
MVMQSEAEVRGPGPAPCRTGDGNSPDPAVLAAALVSALEQALWAAHRLLVALGDTPGYGQGIAVADRSRTERSVARLALVRTAPAFPHGLTAREVDVLRLVAAGQSNREVAGALSVSERTVERHLENTYRKVGARNRADATAYAIRHYLT